MSADGLPFLTADVAAIPGRIKQRPEDFEVEELPVYGPSGAGEHALLWVEKRGLTTPALLEGLARSLGVPRSACGYAGMKDAQAVTRQQVSVLGVDPAAALALDLEGVRVLAAERHRSKLRVGHLRGNRFRVRLRGVDPERGQDVSAVLDALVRRGVPNAFGPQRFGRHGDAWKNGRDLLAGNARRMRRKRGLSLLRFYVSAWQAKLFNEVLAARWPSFDTLLAGDLAWLHDRGAVFRVDEPEREAPRVAAFEISPSGPLFGAEMIEPAGDALAIERAVLAAHGLSGPDLGGPRFLSWKGARRPLRVPARDLAHAWGEDQAGNYLELAFALPAGAYATSVVRELTKTDDLEGLES
jgi:tRNA pseudouridine13 synthase